VQLIEASLRCALVRCLLNKRAGQREWVVLMSVLGCRWSGASQPSRPLPFLNLHGGMPSPCASRRFGFSDDGSFSVHGHVLPCAVSVRT
jgi:hypothetical protein